jgi:hypothetical protein
MCSKTGTFSFDYSQYILHNNKRNTPIKTKLKLRMSYNEWRKNNIEMPQNLLYRSFIYMYICIYNIYDVRKPGSKGNKARVTRTTGLNQSHATFSPLLVAIFHRLTVYKTQSYLSIIYVGFWNITNNIFHDTLTSLFLSDSINFCCRQHLVIARLVVHYSACIVDTLCYVPVVKPFSIFFYPFKTYL